MDAIHDDASKPHHLAADPPPIGVETKELVMDRFLIAPPKSEKLDDDDGNASCSGSWASALISELDHFRASSTPTMAEKASMAPGSRSRLIRFSDEDRPMLKRIASKDAELQSANLLCKDAIAKLSSSARMLDKSSGIIDSGASSALAEALEMLARLDRILDEMRIAVASIGDTSDDDSHGGEDDGEEEAEEDDEECGNSSASTTIVREICDEAATSRRGTDCPLEAATPCSASVGDNAEDEATSDHGEAALIANGEAVVGHDGEKNGGGRADGGADEAQGCSIQPNDIGNGSRAVETGGDDDDREEESAVAIRQRLCDNTREELKAAELELADAKAMIGALEARATSVVVTEEENLRANAEAEARRNLELEAEVAALALELEKRGKQHEDMAARCAALEAEIQG
jgi:hypothetical protein